jgi:hypothetical protein
VKDWQARHEDIERAMADLAPRTLQANVRSTGDYANAQMYTVRLDGVRLSVILEAECVDGALWGHLSVCAQQPKRVPSWDELRWCKAYFLGDRKAVQILPPRAEYVNEHPNVLHLYAALEADPLPDFRGVDSRGRIGI